MLYIFKDSLDRHLICGEIQAREIIDNNGGNRIKYDYLGGADDKEYNKELAKIKATVMKKEDLLNDEYVITIRKKHEEAIKKAEDNLIKLADKKVLPREFKVLNFNLQNPNDKSENIDPRFKGMIK